MPLIFPAKSRQKRDCESLLLTCTNQGKPTDEVPFLEFDITTITDSQAEELKRFHKSYFDVSSILANASGLKYTAALRALLTTEFKSPSEAFVRLFAKQVYSGPVTEKVIFQFTDLLRRSIQHMLSEMVSDRLKSALEQEEKSVAKTEEPVQAEPVNVPKDKLIETTPEELEGFYIVKSILRKYVDPNRIVHRDAQSYMAILLDDNNRKTLARLYFNSSKKYISTFDATKSEVKTEIKDLDDIYKLEPVLKSTVETYLSMGGTEK